MIRVAGIIGTSYSLPLCKNRSRVLAAYEPSQQTSAPRRDPGTSSHGTNHDFITLYSQSREGASPEVRASNTIPAPHARSNRLVQHRVLVTATHQSSKAAAAATRSTAVITAPTSSSSNSRAAAEEQSRAAVVAATRLSRGLRLASYYEASESSGDTS